MAVMQRPANYCYLKKKTFNTGQSHNNLPEIGLWHPAQSVPRFAW